MWVLLTALESLAGNQFFTGTVMAGLLAGLVFFGRRLFASAYNYIKRKLIFSITVEEEQLRLYYFLNNFLYQNYNTQFKNVLAVECGVNSVMKMPGDAFDDSYGGYGIDSKKSKKNKYKLMFVQHNDLYYVKFQGTWIKIVKMREKLEGANSVYNAHINSFTLTAFNRNKLEAFIKYVHQLGLDAENQVQEVKIHTHSWHRFDFSIVNKQSNLDELILDDALRTDIKKDLDEWLNSEEWCRERNIKYKRGYLLHGTPGNGKTSLIAAISRYAKTDVYILQLSSITSDNDLRGIITSIPNNSIIAIEEIDTVWHGRENVRENWSVTFSAFINAIDGLIDKEGCLLILTTNYPEYLDPALIRPGRIDRKFGLHNANYDVVRKYLAKFYSVPIEYLTPTILDASKLKSHSMASLQNACLCNKTDILLAIDELYKEPVVSFDENIQTKSNTPVTPTTVADTTLVDNAIPADNVTTAEEKGVGETVSEQVEPATAPVKKPRVRKASTETTKTRKTKTSK